jgi:integrase/recombinase XerD
MDALLAAPDRGTTQGRRDYAVLLFLYNTGARADEVAHVRIADLDLGVIADRDPSSVLIHGKGNKSRRCPLWAKTVSELVPLAGNRDPGEHVFLNRRRQPIRWSHRIQLVSGCRSICGREAACGRPLLPRSRDGLAPH